jgi:hypothetical protein
MRRDLATALRWEIRRIEAFDDVAPLWERLNAQHANSPLLDADFFRILLRHHGAPGPAVAAVAFRHDQPIAAGLLQRVTLGSWQTVQPSQAPLGAWVDQGGGETENLLRELLRALPGYPLVVGVTQQDPSIAVRPADGARLRTIDYIESAAVPVNSSFADYWEQRGKNLVKNIRRQRNKLQREGVAVSTRWVSEPGAIGRAVDEYGLLESRGWKGAEGTALHPDNLQGRLYRDLLEHYARRDEAFVYQYFYGSELVASELCLHRHKTMYMLKTTYSEAQQGTSPAMLMRQEMLMEIFDRSIFSSIEFYGRLMDWQPKWTDRTKTLYHANVYRSRILATIKARAARRGK